MNSFATDEHSNRETHAIIILFCLQKNRCSETYSEIAKADSKIRDSLQHKYEGETSKMEAA